MSFESLQRAAEAAGFATASDDNQDAPARPQLTAESFQIAKEERRETPGEMMANAAAAVWGRAALGHIIPSWAARG